MRYKDENVSFWGWDTKLTSLSFDFWKLFLGSSLKEIILLSNVHPHGTWVSREEGKRVVEAGDQRWVLMPVLRGLSETAISNGQVVGSGGGGAVMIQPTDGSA